MGFHVHVPAPSVLLDAMARNPELLPMLRTRRNAEHDMLVIERFDLDAGAEQRLREIDRHDADKIEPLAPEKAIERDVDLYDEVAAALRPLILETQSRAFFDARRDLDVDVLLDPDFAGALARGTALRGHGALAAADRAGSIHREPALTERDRPAAFALGTRADRRTFRRARPTARRANLLHDERDRHRPAQRGDTERNRDLGLGFLRLGFATSCAAAPEDRREDVAQAAEVGDVEVAVRRTAAAAPCAGPPPAATAKAARAGERAIPAQLIVFLALLGVAQDVVRFIDLLEALGGLRIVGIAVRVMLFGQPPKGFLDFVRRGGFGDSQHLIVVALCCHYCPCQVSTTTRSGRSNVSRILYPGCTTWPTVWSCSGFAAGWVVTAS